MTETEWLASSSPHEMLALLNQRQKGFFACACVRRVWHLVREESSRTAVEVAEKYLLGKGSRARVRRAADAARDVFFDDTDGTSRADASAVSAGDTVAANGRYAAVYTADGAVEAAGASDVERRAQAALVREVANPFHPVALNPVWLTPTVTGLATATYEEHILPAGTLEPDRLLVLADALEEAGCDNAAVLHHLRSPGPHVRGCWALDLITGKG